MDLVVEEISSMITRGYEGDLRFSPENVIIRHKQEGQDEKKKIKKVKKVLDTLYPICYNGA